MTFKTVDDILAYYGWGGEEEKEDDTTRQDVFSGIGKNQSDKSKVGTHVPKEL